MNTDMNNCYLLLYIR